MKDIIFRFSNKNIIRALSKLISFASKDIKNVNIQDDSITIKVDDNINEEELKIKVNKLIESYIKDAANIEEIIVLLTIRKEENMLMRMCIILV